MASASMERIFFRYSLQVVVALLAAAIYRPGFRSRGLELFFFT
jgi:hypothetical protein